MNEHYKELLLLRNKDWTVFKRDMLQHFAFGEPIPELGKFALSMTKDQWQTVASKLDKLRKEKEDVLKPLRAKKYGKTSEAHREYMKVYMRSYRARKRKEQQAEG